MLGVLGGMGPLATVDFMTKIIAATEARRDQDHIPMIVSSVPQIPDRTEAILEQGIDPLPEMLRGVVTLERAGASLIAIPCNTAHFWYSQLAHFARVPIVNIVDACVDEIRSRRGHPPRVGLMATRGTIAAGIYQRRLAELEVLTPSDLDQVMRGIAAVKGGDLEQGQFHLECAADELLQAKCDVIIMACTEIPVALKRRAALRPEVYIDPTEALAKACVRRWMTERAKVLTDTAPVLPGSQIVTASEARAV